MKSTDQKKMRNRKYANTLLNIVLGGLLLLLLINADAKSWVLQQLVRTGIFNAKIEKGEISKTSAKPAVDFIVRNAEGELFSVASLQGKVVVINFWASWCPPCRAEMPSLNNLYQHFRNDERIIFLFISEDDHPETAASYLRKNNWSLPVYSRSGPVPENIFSGSLPTTIVLNKQGAAVFRHEGLAGYDNNSFIQRLQALL